MTTLEYVSGAARRVRRVGEHGALVECGGAAEASALASWLRTTLSSPPVDVVPAATTVLVVASPGTLGAVLAAVASAPDGAALGATDAVHLDPIEIPVRYDGADLREVADALGRSVERLIAEHTAAAWRVEFIGFAPGFGYCAAADWPHRVPRLDTPRERVPAGAVAIADGWSAVYPRSSPGGWRLIGTTDAALWDETRRPPAVLAAGMPVRFVDATGRST